MAILDTGLAWIQKYDPLLTAIVGLGVPSLVAYLWTQYTSRVRIEIRDFQFPFNKEGIVRSVTFRAINTSDKLTALLPTFTMTGITPKGFRQTYTFTFDPVPMRPLDLRLPPHEDRLFVATHENEKNLIMMFLWYMTFRMPLTKGFAVYFRIRNVDRDRVSWPRFYLERFWFRITARRIVDSVLDAVEVFVRWLVTWFLIQIFLGTPLLILGLHSDAAGFTARSHVFLIAMNAVYAITAFLALCDLALRARRRTTLFAVATASWQKTKHTPSGRRISAFLAAARRLGLASADLVASLLTLGMSSLILLVGAVIVGLVLFALFGLLSTVPWWAIVIILLLLFR